LKPCNQHDRKKSVFASLLVLFAICLFSLPAIANGDVVQNTSGGLLLAGLSDLEGTHGHGPSSLDELEGDHGHLPSGLDALEGTHGHELTADQDIYCPGDSVCLETETQLPLRQDFQESIVS